MAASEVHEELEGLFRRFLDGDATSTVPFQAAIRPLLRRIYNKYAWDLAPDQFDDVVQQTMLLLMQRATRGYDPTRAKAAVFIGLIARRAARDVGAQYAPAGRRTRPRRRSDQEAREKFRRETDVVSLDDLLERDTPATDDFAKTANACLDVALILRQAPAVVRHGLRRIYLEDAAIAQVASEVQLSRFALNRVINSFRASVAA